MDIDMVLEFDRDEMDASGLGSLQAQVQSFVDTVRDNEGLRTIVLRDDDGGVMRLGIGISDHEAKADILRGIADRAMRLEGMLKKSSADDERELEMNGERIARELLMEARGLVGDDMSRRLEDIRDDLEAVESDIDQILIFVDISDRQRKLLADAANHCSKAVVKVIGAGRV